MSDNLSDQSKEVIQGADFGTENPADYFGDLEEVSPLMYPDTERLDANYMMG